MPTCAASKCTSTTGQCSKQFFHFPNPKRNASEKERGTKWLHNMGINNSGTFSFTRTKMLCENHFHSDCFKVDLKAKLLEGKDKKLLIEGSIPTIFPHKEFDQINIDGTNVKKKRQLSLKRSRISEVSCSFLCIYII